MWIYLPNSVSIQDQQASASGLNSQNCITGRSATSRSTPIGRVSSKPGSGTASLTTPRSGMMPRHSTGYPGLASWISLLRASRASRTAQPEGAGALMIPAIFGRRQRELLAKFDPDGCCWRMFAGSICEKDNYQHTLTQSWLTLKTWVMTRSLGLFQLPQLKRLISVGDGGVFPTPQVIQAGILGVFQSRGSIALGVVNKSLKG